MGDVFLIRINFSPLKLERTMKHEERKPVLREFYENSPNQRRLYELFKQKKQIENAMSDIATEIVIDGWFPDREYKTGLTLVNESDDRFQLVIIIKPES
jgi:hypothetical protein